MRMQESIVDFGARFLAREAKESCREPVCGPPGGRGPSFPLK